MQRLAFGERTGFVTFGNHRDLHSGVATVLGLMHAGQDLEFSHGIKADRGVLAAIGACINIGDAVDYELVFCASAPVDLKPAESAHAARRNVCGVNNARSQFRNVQRIAPVDLDVSICFVVIVADRSTLSIWSSAAVAETSTESLTAQPVEPVPCQSVERFS